MRRAALTALALLAGCEIFVEPSPPPGTCSSDQQCPFPQKCFVDGCGTLPDDLLAEVTTSEVTGVTSVDLPVGPARAEVPLVLPNTQVVQLSLRRGALAYPSDVQVVASGESQLLPGVHRTVQTVGSSASGLLPVGISTGRYTVVVSPLDVMVPPATSTGVDVDAGLTPLTVDLLDAAHVQSLAGTVLAGPGQPEPVAPSVQLLAVDGRALSGRATAAPSGTFQLWAGVDALDGGAVLQSTPAAGTLGAVAAFTVVDPARFGQPFLVGDTEAPVNVSGTLLGPDGSPVDGASIFIQGAVSGGGSGNVGPAYSADGGQFAIVTLPQNAPGSLQLWAIPPSGSAAGLLRTAVNVPPGGPVTGSWSSPARPLLQGSLLLPDAGPLGGAVLHADPIAPADPGVPLPPVGGSGLSGPSGVFGLVLDPAVYRLEVEASAGYPVFRTFVRVPATGVQLDPIVLRPGRSLTALVVRENGTVVTQALVRIYHRISVDGGADRALLLGEGVSDGNGRVTILLPQQ